MYTIKSTSEEGVYYFINGWNKCEKFWLDEKSVIKDKENAKRFFFKKPQHAKASLTKLLKNKAENKLTFKVSMNMWWLCQNALGEIIEYNDYICLW